jgi:hypothetical protein
MYARTALERLRMGTRSQRAHLLRFNESDQLADFASDDLRSPNTQINLFPNIKSRDSIVPTQQNPQTHC